MLVLTCRLGCLLMHFIIYPSILISVLEVGHHEMPLLPLLLCKVQGTDCMKDQHSSTNGKLEPEGNVLAVTKNVRETFKFYQLGDHEEATVERADFIANSI